MIAPACSSSWTRPRPRRTSAASSRPIESLGLQAHPIPGAQRTAIGITGNRGTRRPRRLREPARRQRGHPGLGALQARLAGGQAREHGRLDRRRAGRRASASPSSPARARSSRRRRRSRSAGASRRRAPRSTAAARTSRGPRPTPSRASATRGCGSSRACARRRGCRSITEVLDTETVDLVAEHADCLQVGARNMQNFSLLKRLGRLRKPVLLKRGMSATIEELLLSAEYLLAEGNYEVILCERGVRTFADHTRNTLDLSSVPYVQRISHLPILVDPSHGTGKRAKVLPLSRAAVAVGRRRPAHRGAPPARARALGRAAGDPAGDVRGARASRCGVSRPSSGGRREGAPRPRGRHGVPRPTPSAGPARPSARSSSTPR